MTFAHATTPDAALNRRIQLALPLPPELDSVLTEDALRFVARLHDEHAKAREALLERRREDAARIRAGARLALASESADVRAASWSVAPAPRDLERRRVEITGPAEPKMIVNALNSGADAFMCDFEDALSPTWGNAIAGQAALRKAVRRELVVHGENGKTYRLGEKLATLIVRPRGWHLPEPRVLLDGKPMSGSLFDFGLFFFHNARELLARGSGPYFYLPKLEHSREAKLWNAVFLTAQRALDLPAGTIRATVLIETITAAFQMEEILFELREHAAGLNAGRWDYLFSLIKRHAHDPAFVLPDRSQVTMAAPFMQAYCEALVATCHKRAAHAIGGMAAFIPNRREPDVTARALQKVAQDKAREAGLGFDGSWVAHPDLVAVAAAEFEKRLGEKPHQKDARPPLEGFDFSRLIAIPPGGRPTRAGALENVDVAIRYVAAWLDGLGAVAIRNLMEDAATAEISRTQLWQWIRHASTFEDGAPFTRDAYLALADQATAELKASIPAPRLAQARRILDELALASDIPEFLTLVAMNDLNANGGLA